MLKLHQYFLRTSIIFSIASFVVALLFSYYFVKKSKLDSALTKLNSAIEVTTLSRDLNSSYLKKISKELNIRATLINSRGVAQYDTLYNKEKMENHLNRPEILEAKRVGYGSSVRYSTTLKRDLIYIAKKIPQGYLRFATYLESVTSSVYQIMYKITLFILTLIFIIFYLSSKINSKIANGSSEIKDALESMLNKDYTISLSNLDCCKEFNTIGKRVEKVAKKLKKRERQKSRYTKRLKEITKRQGDIISAISHEFKNPVAAIVGYSQTIKDTPNLNDTLKSKFLTKIENNASKISNMIDTLALSINLENNSIAVTYSEFNLSDVAKSAKDILQQKYRDREIILECKDLFVKADKNMFENIFINLTENALKYSEDEVTIKCNKDCVEIIDYGIGIDSEDINKIKDKFYRVDGISWNNSIGVGLFIVDYILKLHNLELDIKSDKKETNFSFYIDKILIY